MNDIRYALQLSTVAELEIDIAERKKLIENMVGDLYPSILRNEIRKLNDRIIAIKFDTKKDVYKSANSIADSDILL